MLHFECDYTEGAHPEIIKKLVETNLEQTTGYGFDEYSNRAKEKIKAACNCPNAEVFFLVGGTQTNSTVISAILRNYEGVVSADTGHVSIHESGAVEASGHKVITLPNYQGKISAEDLSNYMKKFYADDTWPHMAIPGMVYISHPTEYGTLYSKNELEAIKAVCTQYSLPLFLDGARLGYGLMAKGTDVSLEDIAKICDVFYIGGTKVGAMFGEAVVITQKNLISNFFTTIKQRGALLAKGRILGIQFDTLFTDDLYFKISAHALKMTEKLKKIFKEKGYDFFLETPTNQQFILLDNSKIDELKEKVSFSYWEPYDEKRSAVRFATSWATTEKAIDLLKEIL